MQPIASQIEKAVFQPDVFGIFGIARHGQWQFDRRRLHGNRLRAHFDIARRQVGVHRTALARHHIAGDGHHRFDPGAVKRFKRWRCGADNKLSEAEMIAQIDEQHAAMIALAVDPA